MLKRTLIFVIAVIIVFTCCGCSVKLSDEAPHTDDYPDLSLLKKPEWSPDVDEQEETSSTQTAMIDLWLSASQNTGGINPNTDSIFSHAGKKYTEGGFHYHYESQTGWYEAVLQAAIEACGNENIRILRCGNERFPDSFLAEHHLSINTPNEKSSVIRDLLTYSINPRFDVWERFCGPTMENSFYSLGSVQMNQLRDIDANLLENPEQAADMIAALDDRIAFYSDKEANGYPEHSDEDNPLVYALQHIDVSHLSVITADPADIGSLVKRNADGSISELIRKILEERKLFDLNCAVGIYAFQLDYVGQIGTISSAVLSEPLIWGRLQYNANTKLDEGVLPMPRIMVALVIGNKQKVASFSETWNQKLKNRSELKSIRGPKNGELCYSYEGQTVVQEPFSFLYQYEVIERMEPDKIDNTHSNINVRSDSAEVYTENGIASVVISSDEGLSDEVIINIEFPATANAQSSMDWNNIQTISVATPKALILSDIISNKPGVQLEENQQVIPYRDSLYIFSSDNEASDEYASSFCFDGASIQEGKVQIRIGCFPTALKPGWYCVKVIGSIDHKSILRDTPSWVHDLTASVTDEEVVLWEKFSQTIQKNEKNGRVLPAMLSNAWGAYTEEFYHGVRVPQCPPVWKAFELEELVNQIEEEADIAEIPFLNYELHILITGSKQDFNREENQ